MVIKAASVAVTLQQKRIKDCGVLGKKKKKKRSKIHLILLSQIEISSCNTTEMSESDTAEKEE